jgi:hypothetical protein
MFPKKCTLELWIEIFSKINATLKKTRKHIISIWHPYNVYKPIWSSNCKKLNYLAEFYICKGWFD